MKLFQPLIWFFKLSLKKKFKVTVITFLSGVVLGCLIILLTYLSVVNGIFGNVPTIIDLERLNNAKASEVYSSDNVLLGRYYLENRTEVKYEEVNPILINALIATEDSRFYEHTGVDHMSMIRVLVKSILLGKKKGGGSTLSQQLAKNIYGRKHFGALTMPINKMREAIIANKMEQIYSKKDILMLYLNTISFGEDTYGISTACERFFSSSVKDIKTEEAAVLIGMLKSPTIYNPRTKADNAIKRRNVVLKQLFVNHFITEEEKVKLQDLPLTLNYNRISHKDGAATHFREHLRKHLEGWLRDNPKEDGTLYNLYTDGLKIKTTINSKLQQYAQEAVVERLSELQPVLNRDVVRNNVFKRNLKSINTIVKKTNRFKGLIKAGESEKDALKKLKEPIHLTLSTLNGDVDTLLSPTDSVKHYLSQLQAGFLAVNPKNGNILAWVGGGSFQQNQYDHVLSKRQVGSVFKPIVYAEALKNGFKPCDYVSNQAITYTEYENWSPKNSGGTEEVGKYSMAGALANSINTVSVKLCMDVGIKNVIKLAQLLGIDEKCPEVPSIALGTVETSLIKMLGSYTAFANDGVYSKPQFIDKITTNNEKTIYSLKAESTVVLEQEIAHQIINMMLGVVDKGTANRLRSHYNIKGAVAGKTGTTQNQKDGWFMGCTPNWIAGAWVGADYPLVHFLSIRNGQGANTALPIWAKFYKKIEQDVGLKNLIKKQFPFENDIDCADFVEDGFFDKLFKKKSKKDNRGGLEKKKKKKRKGWFRRKSK